MKKQYLLLCTVLMLFLSGCSRMDRFFETEMQNQSGLTADSNYQKYQAYFEQGDLDQDGYYMVDELEDEDDTATVSMDVARVTFSQNAYLNIHYFKDKELRNEILTTSNTFHTGDCVYASIALDDKNVVSTAYDFAGFRLSEIDEDGQRIEITVLKPEESGRFLEITDEYMGMDLTIDPIGMYTNREIILKDSYFDNDEKEHDLSGEWTVNDKLISGHVVEINPISSYVVSYEFDANEYFYQSSNPECFYSNNEDGVVIFNKHESTEEVVNYSVQLHQYLSVDIPSSRDRYVTTNNGIEHEVKAGESLSVARLRYGDIVILVSDESWEELETYRELILQSTEIIRDKNDTYYKYTLIMPQKGGEFAFDPSEYSYAHGTVSFTCFGEEVTSIQYLAPGSKIIYTQRSADKDYSLEEGTHVIMVTTPEETRKQLKKIQFTKSVQVKVKLDQPKYGGRIEYYVNGTKLNSSTYTGHNGDEITMKFFPWEGWINNYNNNEKYKVTTEPSQAIILVGAKNSVAKSAFSESPDHKPKLDVILSKSVGQNMQFTIDASGLSESDSNSSSYQEQFLGMDYTLISKKPIGTERGIQISMSNRAIQSGTAIKMLVEMSGEDKSGRNTQKIDTNYYRLIDSLTDLQDPIDIYDMATMGTSSIWYKTIKITISVVDVKKLSMPSNPANASFSIRNAKTKETLKDGDILEGWEKVTVTITPNNGYYVTGNGVKNGIYQTTVTFDKCISDIQKMLDTHPTKKYILINLDSHDAYGSCIYKQGGRIVSGRIYVKPEDQLTLEYQITDSAYVIDGAFTVLGNPIGNTDKAVVKLITIDQSHDGSTISRESFGIVVKKGN